MLVIRDDGTKWPEGIEQVIRCTANTECVADGHFIDCPRVPDAERAERYKSLYIGALENWRKWRGMLDGSFKRRDEQIELWRGKFREVKHENNKLRRQTTAQNRRGG